MVFTEWLTTNKDIWQRFYSAAIARQNMISIYLISILFVTCHSREIIELNHDLSRESLAWPSPLGYQPFSLTPNYEGFTKEGYWYASYKFCTSEHIGTHLDAPSHFAEKGWTVDQIPLESLFAPAVVIDVRKKVQTNSIYQLSAKDVVEWVEKNGLFPNNSVILVLTGWSNRYGNKASYFGHPNDPKKFAFPGVSASAVQTILGYRQSSGVYVVGIGLDTPSLDYGKSQDFRAHQEVSAANIYVLENLKNIEKVPVRGSELVVMPMKIKRGSGAPCRVMALTGQNFNGGVYLIINNFHILLSLIFCFSFILSY